MAKKFQTRHVIIVCDGMEQYFILNPDKFGKSLRWSWRPLQREDLNISDQQAKKLCLSLFQHFKISVPADQAIESLTEFEFTSEQGDGAKKRVVIKPLLVRMNWGYYIQPPDFLIYLSDSEFAGLIVELSESESALVKVHL